MRRWAVPRGRLVDELDTWVMQQMHGPSRRVLVDAIEMKTLFPAGRVPAAMFTSMRPERVLLGVVMVLLLAMIGRTWDATTSASIPAGAHAHDSIVGEAERVSVLQSLVRDNLESSDQPEAWETDRVDDEAVAAALHARAEADPEAADWPAVFAELDRVRHRGGYETLLDGVHAGLGEMVAGTVELQPARVGGGIVHAVFDTPSVIWEFDRPFAVVYGIVAFFVLGIGGATISRMEAESFGGRDQRRLGATLSWAVAGWRRVMGVLLLLPVLAILVLVIPAVLGVLALVPVLDVLVAVLWGVGLVFGFAAALLVVGWLASLPILVPAAACESGDPTEVVVRTAGLVWRRPFNLLLLLAVAMVAGVLGWLVVSGLIAVALDATRAAAGAFGPDVISAQPRTTWPGLSTIGSNTPPEGLAGTRWLSWVVLDLWRCFVVSLGYGWAVVYIMVAGTRVYLLQRHAVDQLEPDELGQPGPA